MEDNIQRNRIETDSAKSGRKIFLDTGNLSGGHLVVDDCDFLILRAAGRMIPAQPARSRSFSGGAFVPGYGDWSTQRQEAFVEKDRPSGAQGGASDGVCHLGTLVTGTVFSFGLRGKERRLQRRAWVFSTLPAMSFINSLSPDGDPRLPTC